MNSLSRILIATPVDGRPPTATVTHGYHHAAMAMHRLGAVTIEATLSFSDDLVRARSRCVRHALKSDCWDWILWWDEDVVPSDVRIVEYMIGLAEAAGSDMVAAPYPRKRIPIAFPYSPTEADMASGQLTIKDGLVEVERIGFGFTLTSRKCLFTMTQEYSEEWFTDDDGEETVALFRQVMTPRSSMTNGTETKRFRQLLSEDYSFCYRWRNVGGSIYMYVGEGSPVAHVGRYSFEGTVEDVGNV